MGDAVFWLKFLCVVGFAYDLFLVVRDARKKFADPGYAQELEKQKKFFWWNSLVGFVANFFSTLGTGAFAISTAMFKLRGSVDDINIPGTLNAGDTFAVLLQAFLFFDFVQMDPLTLIVMIAAATAGARLGAGVVTKWDRTRVRYAMCVGLFILGCVMLAQLLRIGPFGQSGEALGVRGAKLAVAAAVNCFFGALMNIGVGLYAPCMALCAVLGMNVATAFPVMMGSCAYLLAFGNTPTFIRASRYDLIGVLTNGVFGCIGVYVAFAFVRGLSTRALSALVMCVVFLTSFLFLKDARRKG